MILIKRIAAALLCAGALAACFAQTPDPRIRLNSVGFLPDFPKKASIAASCAGFTVHEAVTGTEMFSGATTPLYNNDTRENLWIADFSPVQRTGTFYIDVPGVGRSPNFRIAPRVFIESYKTMMLGMYLWRCGTAVNATYDNTVFSHSACHMNDGDLRYVGGTGTRDARGGWHDAGDYNKYVVNSGVTVGLMLKAWEHFWFALDTLDLTAVSKSGNIPEHLTEIKWNLDWVAKMQLDDGKVSHKMSTLDFGGNILPESESATRYFVPWGTAATASFVGMLAQAARIYAPYDQALADSYLAKARRSFETLLENPNTVYADQSSFSTGTYSGGDADKRLWAAAEMWETTGEPQYLEYLENLLRTSHVRVITEWGNVSSLAALTYINSSRAGRRQDLVDSMKDTLISIANVAVDSAEAHGYGRANVNYYWGANGAVASTAYTLMQAYRITGDIKYRHAVQDALGHLLGRNYFGRSYVTRMGHNPAKNPHDRRSIASGKTWPGYLIGGPHNQELESCLLPPTCWDDNSSDYRTNEIAINWNSAMIYALSAVLPGSETLPAPCYPGQPECDGVPVRHTAPPRPAAAAKIKTTRVVNTRNGRIDIPPGAKVYSLDGRLVARRGAGDAKTREIRSNGVYIIKIDNNANAQNSGNKINNQ